MADTIITNARVTTLDRANPEGQAVAVRDSLIQAVGPRDEIMRLADRRTRVIDAGGRRAELSDERYRDGAHDWGAYQDAADRLAQWSMGQRVADALGVELPAAARPFCEPLKPAPPDALSIQKNWVETLKGRKVGPLTVKGGVLAADGQRAGSASVLFDAVAMVLMTDQVEKLKMDAAACTWVSDAHAHLKAIGHCQGSKALLDYCNIAADGGVVPNDSFFAAAKRHYWGRESTIRDLA